MSREREPKGQAPEKVRRRWVDRLLVVLMALSPFILLEAGLWIFGYRGPAGNPYRSFVRHEPIFLRFGDRIRLDPDRRELRQNQGFFFARKPPGTLRIICVGDSTTWAFAGSKVIQGYPQKLQYLLERRFPHRSFEVLNCGVVRFASYRLVGVMREILEYEPDVVTLLTGTSEFLEALYHREWRERLESKVSWLGRWKTLSLLRDLIASDSDQRREGEELAERDSCLRADFVIERYVIRDAEEIEATLEHSFHSVRTMVECCREAGVPLLLLTSPSNLRFPPFKSLYEDEASEPLVRTAAELIQSGRVQEAIDLLTPAVARDPGAAALHFRLGQAFDALGDHARAAEAYIRAKDRDAFPHRTLSRFNEDVRRTAEGPGVHLVDLEMAFTQAMPDGIPDNRLFTDQCHPSASANELIASVLYGAFSRWGFLPAD